MSNCPRCNDPHPIRYSSLRKQQCSNCGAVRAYNPNEGDKPLVTNNRDKREEK